jgi:hypothetical protein
MTLTKRVAIPVLCSFLLLGCDSQETGQRDSATGFMPGASRESVVQELQHIQATVLNDTPEMLRAEFKTPEMRNPMLVELAFADGKLTKVNYLPQ